MIILNGSKFAKNESEFRDSLFSEATCVGYYKLNKKSITLFDHNKQKIGVINSSQALCSATQPLKDKGDIGIPSLLSRK